VRNAGSVVGQFGAKAGLLDRQRIQATWEKITY
jgi:hypothetical protein